MTTKQKLTNDIIQQVQNGIQDTLLLHAPDHWHDDDCDAAERQALDSTRKMLTEFNVPQLRSIRAVPSLQSIAARLMMDLIQHAEGRSY